MAFLIKDDKIFSEFSTPSQTITPSDAQNIPTWAYTFAIYRNQAQATTPQTLADFFRAVMRREIETALDWALTRSADGAPSGFYPMRFDLANGAADALKAELAIIPGVLFAAKTANDQAVIAFFATNEGKGAAISDWIRGRLKAKGLLFKSVEGESVNTGLHELADTAPFMAQKLAVLGVDYDKALENSNAQAVFRLWANGYEPTCETALCSIYGASLCAYVACAYGLKKTFTAACDIQIIGQSGNGKTQGRKLPMQSLASRYGVKIIGGLRTTDASIYDDFIQAAYIETLDSNGKLEAMTPKQKPDMLTAIIDESGDTEKSRAGNIQKAQQNIIRRCAIFDGSICTGTTAEQNKRYNGKLPSIIPTRFSMIRLCTENQLKGENLLDDNEGGNLRRVLYAKTKQIENTAYMTFDERRALQRKYIPSDDNEERLASIYDYINEHYNGDTPAVFTLADDDETKAAVQAALIAFTSLGIPDECFNTVIFNTATWLSVLRNGAKHEDSLEIGANEINTACAICMNSFQILSELTNKSLVNACATARTETQKQNQLLAYIEKQKDKCADKRYIERYLGKDFVTLAKHLVDIGVLIETTINKHKAFRLATADEQEQIATEREIIEGAAQSLKAKESVFDGNQGAAKQDTHQSKGAPSFPISIDSIYSALDDEAKALQNEGMTGQALIHAMRDIIKDNPTYSQCGYAQTWLDDFKRKQGICLFMEED
jgi:hypothetical protein